jgi:hypothetical protein
MRGVCVLEEGVCAYSGIALELSWTTGAAVKRMRQVLKSMLFIMVPAGQSYLIRTMGVDFRGGTRTAHFEGVDGDEEEHAHADL